MSDFKLYLSGLLQREGGRWGGEKREKGNGTGKGRGREEEGEGMEGEGPGPKYFGLEPPLRN